MSGIIKNEKPDEFTDSEVEAAYLAVLAAPPTEPTAAAPRAEGPIIPTSQGRKLSEEAQREIDFFLNLGKQR